MTVVKFVRAWGNLRVSQSGDETVIRPERVQDGIDAISIDLSNGMSIQIGRGEGGPDEPITVELLDADGEAISAGGMSWSNMYQFPIPER